jgi:hypothetical protein
LIDCDSIPAALQPSHMSNWPRNELRCDAFGLARTRVAPFKDLSFFPVMETECSGKASVSGKNMRCQPSTRLRPPCFAR